MNKIKKLRKFFKSFTIDGYLIPKNDEYFNEYVSQSKERLKFISNFSGSAGFAVILKNKNYLFVDGRYTIQARYQSGKNFKIITIPGKFPKDVLKTNKKIVLGFDPKLHTEKQLNFLFKIKNVDLKSINQNLIDIVWSNKPKEFAKPFFSLSAKNTGTTTEKKILQIKNIISKNNVDYLLVTAPENVAWILNIRGYDSSYSPIPNSRLLVSKKGDVNLFVNPKKNNKNKENSRKKSTPP